MYGCFQGGMLAYSLRKIAYRVKGDWEFVGKAYLHGFVEGGEWLEAGEMNRKLIPVILR
jgi:hypothetical protein